MGAARAMMDSTVPNLAWPGDVEFVLSALDAASVSPANRRKLERRPLRVVAALHLFSEGEAETPKLLYTRDATARGLGFVTRTRLPLGYGGVVELADVHGRLRRAECTVLRCREAVAGWYEGALQFNRRQFSFVADA